MQKLVAHFMEYCYYLNVGSEQHSSHNPPVKVTASSAERFRKFFTTNNFAFPR
jgi:hypothetical protein